MSYSIPDITNWARVTYNEAPDPRTMVAILEAMDAALTELGNVRPIFGDDDALAGWDDEANKLYLRIQAYYEQRNAMAAGEITGQYTAHVVAPILHGQGYASPGQEIWSKVRTPDVGTPFTLANQLIARAENMGILDRIRDVLIDAPEYPDRIVQGFVEKIYDGARNLGAAGAKGAADVLEERADRFVDKVKPQLGAEAKAGALAVIVGGAVALLVLGALLRGRK